MRYKLCLIKKKNENNSKQFTFSVNKADEDVLKQLEIQDSVNAYIVGLIKDDIKNQKIIENLKKLVSEEDWNKITKDL